MNGLRAVVQSWRDPPPRDSTGESPESPARVGEAPILPRSDPRFEAAVERGIRPLVLELTDRLGFLTYSSCEGHADPGDSALSSAHVAILPLSVDEHLRSATTLCTVRDAVAASAVADGVTIVVDTTAVIAGKTRLASLDIVLKHGTRERYDAVVQELVLLLRVCRSPRWSTVLSWQGQDNAVASVLARLRLRAVDLLTAAVTDAQPVAPVAVRRVRSEIDRADPAVLFATLSRPDVLAALARCDHRAAALATVSRLLARARTPGGGTPPRCRHQARGNAPDAAAVLRVSTAAGRLVAGLTTSQSAAGGSRASVCPACVEDLLRTSVRAVVTALFPPVKPAGPPAKIHCSWNDQSLNLADFLSAAVESYAVERFWSLPTASELPADLAVIGAHRAAADRFHDAPLEDQLPKQWREAVDPSVLSELAVMRDRVRAGRAEGLPVDRA